MSANIPHPADTGSLRRRLYGRIGFGLLAIFALLTSLILRYADTASERAYDQVLSASALTLSESLRLENGVLRTDVPAAAFAMLARMADDRVFYRLIDDDGRTITGYDDLPTPALIGSEESGPHFLSTRYKDVAVRVVAVRRLLTQGERPRWATTLVAQSLNERQALARDMGGYAVIGLLILAATAGGLVVLAITAALRPVAGLKQVIAGRGAQDFTPLRQPVPEEIQPLQSALNQLLARFESSLTDTRTLLADASHQLKTPLSSLIAQAEMALRDAGPDQREQMGRILRNARSAARIANQILTDATVSNRLELAPRAAVPLARLCADVINDRLGGDDVALRLFVQDDDAATACIAGDHHALADALRNLIDNALKYGPPAGPVDITLACHHDHVSLSVRDRGPGLAPADRPRVLRRFERGSDRLPADRLGGSGLGLAIVQRVVTGHEGHLTLDDAPGGGLLVTVTFPRQAEDGA